MEIESGLLEWLSSSKKWTSVTLGKIIKNKLITEDELNILKKDWLTEKEIIDLVKWKVICILLYELMWIADQKVLKEHCNETSI